MVCNIKRQNQHKSDKLETKNIIVRNDFKMSDLSLNIEEEKTSLRKF